jgi:hypothetical protein
MSFGTHLCVDRGIADKGTAAIIGETQGGWFWLPPWSLWEPWAKEGLEGAEKRMAPNSNFGLGLDRPTAVVHDQRTLFAVSIRLYPVKWIGRTSLPKVDSKEFRIVVLMKFMHSPQLKSRVRTLSAVVAASIALPAMVYADRDNDKVNQGRGDNFPFSVRSCFFRHDISFGGR